MHPTERALHWRVNCYCNRRCSFCYGPQKLHEVDFEGSVPVLERLLEYGVRNYVLTGGEPLLSKKFDRVLRFLAEAGARVAVYTNCDYFDFHEDTIMETVDTLCIPLDGGSEYTHDSVRGRDNFRAVLGVLDRIGHGSMKIKVGTVLGRHNLYDLDAISYIVQRYDITSWKLYEYLRYEDRDLQKRWDADQLGITDQEYRAATERLLSGLPVDYKAKVVVSTEYDRANSYFMMNPDLEIIAPQRGEDGVFRDVHICDATQHTAAEIEELWRASVDAESYQLNIRRTFAFG